MAKKVKRNKKGKPIHGSTPLKIAHFPEDLRWRMAEQSKRERQPMYRLFTLACIAYLESKGVRTQDELDAALLRAKKILPR